MGADVSMDVKWSLQEEPAALRIEYTIVNGDGPIGLFNRIPRVHLDGTVVYDDPAVAYVELDGEALRIARMALPEAEDLSRDGLSPDDPPVPDITVLGPGERFREVLLLPVPVRACDPLRRAELLAAAPSGSEAIAAAPEQATEISFSVGYFPIDDAVRPLLTPRRPAHPEVWTAFPKAPVVARQALLNAAVVAPAGIDVLDYEVFSFASRAELGGRDVP